MNTLCIIPCGKLKIWDKDPNAGPVEAKRVYVGPFSLKCREYAERFYPDSWCILSAKYGFLFPNDIVPGPYNVCFNNKKSHPISYEELQIQIVQKGLDKVDKVVLLGGREYRAIANNIFNNKEVHNPLIGCQGIGYMMGRLNDSIKSGNPLESPSIGISHSSLNCRF